MSEPMLFATDSEFLNAENIADGTLCQADDDGALYVARHGIWEPLESANGLSDDAPALRKFLDTADDPPLSAFYCCEGTIAGRQAWASYVCIVLLRRDGRASGRTFTLRATTGAALAQRMTEVGLEPSDPHDVTRLCESAGANPPLRRRRASRPSEGEKP
jgi:hypothetical protein